MIFLSVCYCPVILYIGKAFLIECLKTKIFRSYGFNLNKKVQQQCSNKYRPI